MHQHVPKVQPFSGIEEMLFAMQPCSMLHYRSQPACFEAHHIVFWDCSPHDSSPCVVAQIMANMLPLWNSHLKTHDIFDGDAILIHHQEHTLAQRGGDWRSGYYMPTNSDRLLAGFRQWLDKIGGGRPQWLEVDHEGGVAPPPRVSFHYTKDTCIVSVVVSVKLWIG